MQANPATAFVGVLQRLRDLIAGNERWWISDASGIAFSRSGAPLDEVPLGRYEGVAAVFIDIPPGRRFPGYSERREMLMDREAADGRRVSILSNAAASRLICCWRERHPSGAVIYREEPMPRRAQLQLSLLTSAAHAVACREHALPESPERAIHRRLLQLTSSETVPSSADPDRVRDALIAMIEGATSPVRTRLIWRNLSRIKLLDPDCREGSWLTAGALAMKPLYEISLLRMGGWLSDAARERTGTSLRLRDFRKLEDLVSIHGVENLSSHLVLFNNIHGVASQALHAECTRLQISIALQPEAMPEAFPQLAMCILVPPTDRPAGPGRPVTAAADDEQSRGGAAELWRVHAILRDLQLEGRSTAAQLSRAYAELARRLTAAVPQIQHSAETPTPSSASLAARLTGIGRPAHIIISTQS